MAWRFPLVWLVPHFALGICLAACFGWTGGLSVGFWLLAQLLLAVGLCALGHGGLWHARLYFVSTMLLFTALGAWTYVLHLPQNECHHYARALKPGKRFAQIALRTRLSPSAHHRRWIAEVVSLGTEKTRGAVLVYLPRSSADNPFHQGARYAVYARFRRPPAQRNPYRFDYAAYLFNRNVPWQLSLEAGTFERLTAPPGFLDGIRRGLEHILSGGGLSPEARALLEALLLGTRADLQRPTLRSFVRAGVVHVLAVSGLHIGILALLLRLLFAFLLRWRRGRALRALLIVLLLFSFAALLHFKPSITRATLMFGFLTLADSRGRPTNPFNALALAALLTLLIWPKMLFQLGFQLSYAVVVFILWLYPHLSRSYRPTNRLLDYLWRILLLSIVAQLGALPLILFYFHRVSTLFWLSNLVVVPLVTGLIALGIAWVSIAALGVHLALFTRLINAWVSVLLAFIKVLSHWSFASVKGVYFDGFMAFSLFALLFFLGLFFEYRKAVYLLVLLFLSIGIQLHFIGEKCRSMGRKAFVVLDGYKGGLALYRVADQAFVFCRPADSLSSRQALGAYCTDEMVTRLHYIAPEADYDGPWLKKLHSYCYTGDFTLQLVSGSGLYHTRWLADFMWLQGLPMLRRLPPQAFERPHWIILDAHAYRRNAAAFKALAAAVPSLKVYDTRVSGAFQLSIN